MMKEGRKQEQSNKKSKKGLEKEKTTANFMEDDERVTFVVEGQDSEFLSDCDQASDQEMSDVTENEEMDCEDNLVSVDNNATAVSEKQTGKSKKMKVVERDEVPYCDSEADTVKDKVEDGEEERFFMKWEQFLKKRALKITEIKETTGPKEQDESGKGGHKNSGKFAITNAHQINSETTIYKPAVDRESDVKRMSSSSEEGGSDQKLDTSDENEPLMIEDFVNQFLGEQRDRIDKDPDRRHKEMGNCNQEQEPQPGTSRGNKGPEDLSAHE